MIDCGWPSFKDLARSVEKVVATYDNGVRTFLSLAQGLDRNRKLYHEVRCPLDIRRKSPNNVPWHPVDLLPFDIGDTVGLVDVLKWLKRAPRGHGQATVPFLADMNIYWRVLKLVYHRSHCHLNLRVALQSLCPVYGVWHA